MMIMMIKNKTYQYLPTGYRYFINGIISYGGELILNLAGGNLSLYNEVTFKNNSSHNSPELIFTSVKEK
jgi:hypothetical protein